MTPEYFSLANPFLMPLKATAAAFVVLLIVFVVIALCKSRAESRWYEQVLAGMIAIAFVGMYVVALDVDKYDPATRIAANVHAKYDVDNLKISGGDPSTMTAQVSLPDGLHTVYNLAINQTTGEPALTATRSFDPNPSTLERKS